MPRELQDVEVGYISLVNKGANKQQIEIYKSDDCPATDATMDTSEEDKMKTKKDMGIGEGVEKEAGLLERILKSVTEVFKSDTSKTFEQKMQESIANSNLWRCVDTLQYAIWDILYSNSATPKDEIATLIDQFKVFYLDNLTVLGIEKAEQQMKESLEKSDKELPKQNAELTQAQVASIAKSVEALGEVLRLEKASNISKEEGETDMNAEVLKAVLEPLTKSVQELTDKVTALEKNSVTPEVVEKATEAVAQAAEAVEKAEQATTEAVAKVEKSAEELVGEVLSKVTDSMATIAKSVESLGERIAKMEESPVTPNGNTEPEKLEKSKSDFNGVLTFTK